MRISSSILAFAIKNAEQPLFRKRDTPEWCYMNHKRNAHVGKHDPTCNACRELKIKARKS